MSKAFLFFILLVGMGLAGFKIWASNFEQRSLYYPERPWQITPTDIGLEFEDLYLKADDGTNCNAWYVPCKGARYTVLFFHGNAGNIADRIDFLRLFHGWGLATLILEYRGYGKSNGRPSEKGLYKDADSAYRYLTQQRGVAPDQIILFGESLGCAVAIDLAVRKPVRALICESPFSNILDMAAWYHPYLPARLMVTQRFDSLSKIARVPVPKFFLHSPLDEVVPFPLGKKLFDAAPEPKQFFQRPGQHSDVEAAKPHYQKIFTMLK